MGIRKVLCLIGVFCCFCVSVYGSELDDYVGRADDSYRYEVVRTVSNDGGTGYIIDMVSQTWRCEAEVDRVEWRHWVHIAIPKKVRFGKALLIIDGGANGGKTPKGIDSAVASIAIETGSVVARIQMIPNEPLRFNGENRDRSEDAIIAYSWDKYMATGDADWIAQLPMTKSAVRAMDTVEDFVKKKTGRKIEGFVVTGASKRGWTTWLTGVVDKRVVAIAPIVIDMLNSQKSFRHHYSVYGFYAPAVRDYEEMGIFRRLGTPVSDELMKIVDPYSYRDRLTMPKLIINSAGDQFFCPDSWQFYYEGLKGEKHLRYVPNCGHGLEDTDALETLTLFYESILKGWKRPDFSFKSTNPNVIEVKTKERPVAVKLWQATNPDARDFRVDVFGKGWTSSSIEGGGDGSYTAKVEEPTKGYTAFFVELTYESPGKRAFKFTTGTRVVPDMKPFSTKIASGGGK